MKHLAIFVLFLVAFSDVTGKCTHYEVTISDALPIQFWLSDCETYNEKEVCGVHRKCWCHPWDCDDELTIQFSDESVSEYVLRVYDSNNNFLEDVDFDITQFLDDPFSDLPFTSWTNVPTGDGNAWTIDSTPSVSVNGGLTGETSDYLRRPIVVIAGTHTITYNVTSAGTGGLRFVFRKNGIQVGSAIESPVFSGEGSFNVTLSDESDEVLIFTSVGIGSSFNLEFNNLPSAAVALKDPIYTANYTPVNGDESVCNEQIRFEIVEIGISPENVIAKSDCLDVRSSHDCTTLIEYSNNRDVFGLVYEDTSPAQTFKTRVPAIFFHERFPEEDNVIELTDSLVKTNSTLRAQRLFETDYVPYYLHRKLQLIFKHQTVLIDNQYWTKQEAYEIQDGERRWPVKKAKCFLSEKNYVQRAVL